MFRIREILIEKGMTNADLQKILGVSKQYISNIINGRQNVSVPKLQEIANALGVNISELFVESINKKQICEVQIEKHDDFIAMIRFRGDFYHATSLVDLEAMIADWKRQATAK